MILYPLLPVLNIMTFLFLVMLCKSWCVKHGNIMIAMVTGLHCQNYHGYTCYIVYTFDAFTQIVRHWYENLYMVD